jgi:hypothetical protein
MSANDEEPTEQVPVEAIVSQLRERSRGRYFWRVQNKDTRAYCIEFTEREQPEAFAWWEENRRKYPGYHRDNELVKVLWFSPTDKLMQKAADMLERMSG